MSLKEDTRDKPKSDGASSDICIVDNDSINTSGETACWKRSSPATSFNNHSNNINKNSSPAFISTPSPSPSPSPVKPVSRLKRIILAPSQPNSPKRFNKEIKIAIEKLRPINKYKFEEPSGHSPNTKFSAAGTKFTASNSSTPRKSGQTNSTNSQPNATQPITKPQILENIILKKAPNLSNQEINIQQHSNQQILNELHDQRLSLQNQLSQIEQKLQYKQQKSITPTLAQTQQPLHIPCTTTVLKENDAQHTPPSTPSPKGSNDRPRSTPPQKSPTLHSPTIVQQQETFAQQFQKHIDNYKKTYISAESPTSGQKVTIPWATQFEKQQQKLEELQHSIALKSSNHKPPTEPEKKSSNDNSLKHIDLTLQKTPKKQLNIPSPKPYQREVSSKIPSVFIPYIASIERLSSMIDKSPIPISYTTTASQEGGVRIKCGDTDSYNNLMQLLQQQNVYLHTHQRPEDRGLRIVIRNLHASTSTNTIRTLLADQGYEVKYVSVLKNRFTGIPLNMFEVEIGAKNLMQAEQVLGVTRLGSQEVAIERQARRTDPVQCFRCQAFGHSKNYCRRPFVCLKCAGNHPSYDCKKDKCSKGLCANCKGDHIASYKGCPIFKKERTKLLAARPNNPIDIHAPSSNMLKKPIIQLTQQQQPFNDNQQTYPVQQQTLHQPREKTQQIKYQSPKPQRARVLNANSPLLTKQRSQTNENFSVPSNRAKHLSSDKMTYSEVAREATIKTRFTAQDRTVHQNFPRQSQQPQLNQHQQQPGHHSKSPFSQLPSKIGQQTTSQPQQIGQNNSELEFMQIKAAVHSNAQNIYLLSNKIDKLYKLVDDHITSIHFRKQNIASEQLNDAK